MTRSVPVFMPVDKNDSDNTAGFGLLIKEVRTEERRIIADRYAFRMRNIGMLAVRDKLDCYQIAELLEGEASRAENESREGDHA
ncbi:DUF2732 family protein [Morganella morganii]|uniref:DUF2732 family protein n=1 Tax=Morganella morganii TaxID=582 RepID=UPI001A18A83D|nr:DUF2732 family protein [Morganella morganii]WPU19525.1 DUF2732 family protein [Morganella morganii]HCD1105762.1 DUF2732 family protein [Morganella morganii]